MNAETAETAEKERQQLDGITDAVIGGALAVHRALGPGLLESAYEACLAFELAERGFKVETQKALPVCYRGVRLDCGYRLDMLIDERVIVEVKAIEALAPVHEAQLLSYLRLSGLKVGLVINFHVKMLRSGIRRVVNEYPESLRSLRSQRSNPPGPVKP